MMQIAALRVRYSSDPAPRQRAQLLLTYLLTYLLTASQHRSDDDRNAHRRNLSLVQQ